MILNCGSEYQSVLLILRKSTVSVALQELASNYVPCVIKFHYWLPHIGLTSNYLDSAGCHWRVASEKRAHAIDHILGAGGLISQAACKLVGNHAVVTLLHWQDASGTRRCGMFSLYKKPMVSKSHLLPVKTRID